MWIILTYGHWNGIRHTHPVFPSVSQSLHFRPERGAEAVVSEYKVRSIQINSSLSLKCHHMMMNNRLLWLFHSDKTDLHLLYTEPQLEMETTADWDCKLSQTHPPPALSLQDRTGTLALLSDMQLWWAQQQHHSWVEEAHMWNLMCNTNIQPQELKPKSLNLRETYFYKRLFFFSMSGFQCIQSLLLHWGNIHIYRSIPLCFQPGNNLWDANRDISKSHHPNVKEKPKLSQENSQEQSHSSGLEVFHTALVESLGDGSIEAPSSCMDRNNYSFSIRTTLTGWFSHLVAWKGTWRVFGILFSSCFYEDTQSIF